MVKFTAFVLNKWSVASMEKKQELYFSGKKQGMHPFSRPLAATKQQQTKSCAFLRQ
jgi:hypothetical protein